MSLSLSRLFGYRVHATDGELGTITDVYFDDRQWTVRYFVVKVGSGMNKEAVLLSPICISNIDSSRRRIDVSLDVDKVKNSPDVDTEKTVTMQMEADTMNYYRWPLYWTDVGIWGAAGGFGADTYKLGKTKNPTPNQSHLRSTKEVMGYYVKSDDKKFGKILDVLVNSSNWVVESFVAKTRRWLPSRAVLLAPDKGSSLYWPNGEFRTSLSHNQIRDLPEFRPGKH